MAKVFYGSQVVDLAGSIGGLSFQKNASGAIAKLRPGLSQSLSESQIIRNYIFSDSLVAYNNLSAASKALWKAFAAAHNKVDFYGTTKKLSGQNWFCSLYMNAVACSLTPLTDPPTYAVVAAPPMPINTLFDTSVPSMWFQFDSPYALADDFLFVFCSPLTFESSLINRSNIFYLFDLSMTSVDEVEFYDLYDNFWFSDADFQISGLNGVNVRVSMFRMSRTSFLCSAFTSFLLTAIP